MSRDPLLSRDDRRDIRQGTLFGMGYVTVIVIFFALLIGGLSIAHWGFGVWTSDIKGKGDAVKIKNDGLNRIQQQEKFEQFNADFDGYIVKIGTAKANLAAAKETPTKNDDPQREVELNGLIQICVDTAQNYNAAGRKYSARDFKASDLPAKLDPALCA